MFPPYQVVWTVEFPHPVIRSWYKWPSPKPSVFVQIRHTRLWLFRWWNVGDRTWWDPFSYVDLLDRRVFSVISNSDLMMSLRETSLYSSLGVPLKFRLDPLTMIYLQIPVSIICEPDSWGNFVSLQRLKESSKSLWLHRLTSPRRQQPPLRPWLILRGMSVSPHLKFRW